MGLSHSTMSMLLENAPMVADGIKFLVMKLHEMYNESQRESENQRHFFESNSSNENKSEVLEKILKKQNEMEGRQKKDIESGSKMV